jgi:hypothetical protein
MPNAPFYRAEAERYRRLAAAEAEPELKAQLLSFARDHDTLADLLDQAGGGRESAAPPPQAQHQPMQQQQQKKDDDT